IAQGERAPRPSKPPAHFFVTSGHPTGSALMGTYLRDTTLVDGLAESVGTASRDCVHTFGPPLIGYGAFSDRIFIRVYSRPSAVKKICG
ncbi:MAG: hypothetical protein ABSE59_09095, partial [Opitutaceae bacterium]